MKIRWIVLMICLFLMPALVGAQETTSDGQPDAKEVIRWKTEGWVKTNFAKTEVPFDEILSGGPPRDGIPPIYSPKFVSVKQASAWLPDSEPVIVFQDGADSRAYPYRVLIWHEIVNDTKDDKSFIVTFCPLCNSAIIYDTHFEGQNHIFGVSGKLRNSDMVMWDHTTESWWQQLTGKAIVGDATGTQLKMMPSPSISFGAFKKISPQGKVLAQRTGFDRPYGQNPYVGYEMAYPFLFRGEVDDRLPALARVIGIEWKDQFYTLPLSELLEKKWASVELDDDSEIIIFNMTPANSALDGASIAQSTIVDHVTIFQNRPGSKRLEFVWKNNKLLDTTDQLEWNALGQGYQGSEMKGSLDPVHYGIHFAFAWLAFHPDSTFLKL